MMKNIEVKTGITQPLLSSKVQPVSRDGEIPLSFAQQRLWFLDQLEPGNPFYNIPAVVYMTGLLDAAALEQAISEIIRRHEVLRTTFSTANGRPVQQTSKTLRLHIPLIKLPNLPEAEKESEVRRLINEEAKRPFDLAAGPLLRATLLQTGEREHVLLLTMHHIISDGWSMGVLMREVGVLYVSYANGRPSPLPELPVQYADFAHWQQNWLQGDVLQKQLAYWVQQLAGAPTILELPADRPRHPVQTYRGAYLRFELPGSLSQELNALSRREGVTLFMVLLAAFVTLLHRYTEQEDILVGTPIANRNRSEIEGLIGFFVNTLVLRAKLSPEISFLELVRQMREVTLGAYAHQDIPFEKLVDEFHPEREMSRSPLFQVMFALQNAPMGNVELPGLKLRLAAGDSGTSKFDLTMYLEESAGALIGAWEYSTDLFDETTIRRMTTHFRTLLESIVSDPQRLVRDLPLLPESERQQLLVEFNDTRTDFPQGLCLHQLFEEQAARTPESVALVFEDEEVSYHELNLRAEALAHHLRSLGVRPEVRVGILVERSVEMVVAVLGILKAGGAYVPLDPEYPAERLRFMLEDAEVSVLITQRRLVRSVTEHGARVCYLDDEAEGSVWQKPEEELAREEATAENLAYVIYTSGSTGTPKGVAIAHRSIVNFLLSMCRTPGLSASDRLAAVATLAFDISILDLFLPLTVGGRVEVLSREIASDGHLLAARLAAGAASVLQATPATWRLLLSSGWSGSPQLKALCGGERLAEELAEEMIANTGEVWNMYGPTETTVWSSVSQVKAGQVSLGGPIANMRFYVLDREMELVPVGVSGELYIGGEGVARGYLGRADLTADRFVPDPYGTQRGARLYRTGDVVRRVGEGNLAYIGRADYQVKVRGHRVELGEIEAALREHATIRDVCVLLREDVPGDQRLVAYVVTEEQQSPTVSELRAFLQERLPDYMLPAVFMMLEALPISPNGKVDRRALPVPEQGRPDLEQGYVAPRTAIEEALAGIWSQVLGVEQVGVNDNFFELGGDSILTIQIVSKAKSAGLDFAPKQLFQHQTVAELATVVKISTAVEAEQSNIEGAVPLTPVQHWFFEHNVIDQHHLNQALMLEVRGTPEAELLRRAMQHLHLHHDALRLRFERSEAGWQQFNEGTAPPGSFSRVDISNLPEDVQTTAMTKIAASVQSSLELSKGPLLKAVLFEPGAGRATRLLLVAHYLVADGVSWGILLEDLQKVYAQLSRGEKVWLGPKTSSFKQWAERLKEYAGSVALESNYWLNALGRKVLRLPLDYQGHNVAASAQSVLVKLDAEETSALLKQVLAAYRMQIDEVLLTAAAQSFKRWIGQPLLVDLEGRGREDLMLELNLTRTVGCLRSVYPALLDADDEATPGEALNSMKEQLRGIPGKGIGYGLLRYLSGDDAAARLRALPAAEVSFKYLGQLSETIMNLPMFCLAKESAGPSQSPRGRRGYLIEINGGIFDDQLQMSWTYSERLHRRSTIEQLADSFVEALRNLIAHCQSEEVGEVIPSDFPLARLDQHKLSKLAGMINQEDESDPWTA